MCVFCKANSLYTFSFGYKIITNFVQTRFLPKSFFFFSENHSKKYSQMSISTYCVEKQNFNIKKQNNVIGVYLINHAEILNQEKTIIY